jgi:hypothetical protein
LIRNIVCSDLADPDGSDDLKEGLVSLVVFSEYLPQPWMPSISGYIAPNFQVARSIYAV